MWISSDLAKKDWSTLVVVVNIVVLVWGLLVSGQYQVCVFQVMFSLAALFRGRNWLWVGFEGLIDDCSMNSNEQQLLCPIIDLFSLLRWCLCVFLISGHLPSWLRLLFAWWSSFLSLWTCRYDYSGYGASTGKVGSLPHHKLFSNPWFLKHDRNVANFVVHPNALLEVSIFITGNIIFKSSTNAIFIFSVGLAFSLIIWFF